MILVGPGGATALDVWATAEEWRMEIPAASILRRGGASDDAMLPIGFFRWWFLAPAEGRLLTSVEVPGGERFVVRSGAATVDMTDVARGARRWITATRRASGLVERVELDGASFAMATGDHATYDAEASGVHVEVTVEAPADAPDPAAFVDPDVAARAEGPG
jgi:hypothetical protein